MNATPITIHGEEFFLLSKADYYLLKGIPEGSEDAVTFATRIIADDLRKMREDAGLTQVELAKRLKRSQAFVSGAEKGTSRVGERYVKAVMAACGVTEE